jgi:hypothetical protein
MRAWACLVIGLSIALASARAVAQAPVLDTFGPGNSVGAGAQLVNASNVLAVRFTTPAGVATVIDRVDLSIGVVGVVPGANISIWAEAGGLPSGAPIISQAVTAPLFGSPSLVLQAFTSDVVLAPATNYWVGIQTNTADGNGVIWAFGQSAAPVASFPVPGWANSGATTPAVRVLVRNAPPQGCAPTQGADTIGTSGFTGAGSLGLSTSVTAAWRMTVPPGPSRPVLSVEVPLGVVGSVNGASIEIWNANPAGTLPTGAPIRSQPINAPIGTTPALISTSLIGQPPLPPGTYFVGVRAQTSPTGFLIWAAAPIGAAQVPNSFDGGQTWLLSSNPNPPAIRVNLGCPATVCQFGPIFDLFGPGNTFASTGPVSGTSVHAVRFEVPADGVPRLAWLVDTALQASQPNVNVTLNIWPDVAGLPSSNPIITASAPIATTSPQVVQWILNSPIPLPPGSRYWVGLTAMGPGTVTFFRGGLPVEATTAIRSPGGAWSVNASTADTLAVRVLAECADFGACCNARGGGCVLLSRADCSAVGGAFGAGLPCLGIDCPALTKGACCRGVTCAFIAQADCTGGTFLGAGVSCSPPRAGGANVCCAADVDNSGVRTVDDIFIFLNVWFAACP